MLDASLPAVPTCGAEQVVFRAHLDANCVGETRKGMVLLVWSTPCEAFPDSCVWRVGQSGRHGDFGPHQTELGANEIVLMYHQRDWALAKRALVKQDFEAFVIEKDERAETAAVRGESRALYYIVKELGGAQASGFQESDSRGWVSSPGHEARATTVVTPLRIPAGEGDGRDRGQPQITCERACGQHNLQPTQLRRDCGCSSYLSQVAGHGSRWRREGGVPICPTCHGHPARAPAAESVFGRTYPQRVAWHQTG